jgi:hypothetical protein
MTYSKKGPTKSRTNKSPFKTLIEIIQLVIILARARIERQKIQIRSMKLTKDQLELFRFFAVVFIFKHRS